MPLCAQLMPFPDHGVGVYPFFPTLVTSVQPRCCGCVRLLCTAFPRISHFLLQSSTKPFSQTHHVCACRPPVCLCHPDPHNPCSCSNPFFGFAVQAKTTKKVTLRLECKLCKAKKQLVIARCKHFELGEKKQATGHQY